MSYNTKIRSKVVEVEIAHDNTANTMTPQYFDTHWTNCWSNQHNKLYNIELNRTSVLVQLDM